MPVQRRSIPKRAEVANNQGWSLMLRGRWAEALAAFERAAAHRSEHCRAWPITSSWRAPPSPPTCRCGCRAKATRPMSARLNDAGVVAAASGNPSAPKPRSPRRSSCAAAGTAGRPTISPRWARPNEPACFGPWLAGGDPFPVAAAGRASGWLAPPDRNWISAAIAIAAFVALAIAGPIADLWQNFAAVRRACWRSEPSCSHAAGWAAAMSSCWPHRRYGSTCPTAGACWLRSRSPAASKQWSCIALQEAEVARCSSPEGLAAAASGGHSLWHRDCAGRCADGLVVALLRILAAVLLFVSAPLVAAPVIVAAEAQWAALRQGANLRGRGALAWVPATRTGRRPAPACRSTRAGRGTANLPPA